MQSELQVWQVALCETMSSSESEVNNWHRRDPWRTMCRLFRGVCCCLRAEISSKRSHKSPKVPQLRVLFILTCFSGCFFQSCRDIYVRNSLSRSLQLSVKERSVEMFMWQVWFFHPYKSHESSAAATTKAADSQRNVVQARNINLFAPNCSSNCCRNISYIIYTSVAFSCGVLFS